MSFEAIAEERLKELKARALHRGKRADVFIINRSAFAEMLDRKRESLCWVLLNELREGSGAVRLWANKDREASRQLGPPEFATGERAIWLVPANAELKTVVEADSNLGWALFFNEGVDRPLTIPSAIATEPSQLEELTHEMNSKAIVVSWYDDTEWLVVLATHCK